MNNAREMGLNPADLVRIVRTHVRLWAIPGVICAVLAAAYALITPREWCATQTLIIRAEAAGVHESQVGKFSDLSEMKTLQETILELAKCQSVVLATLRESGPPANYRRPSQWPTPTDVDKFRKQIDMRPPGGAEFGKTEVFHLSVRDTHRERAARLVATLYDQVQIRLKQLRDERAQGMIAELERTVAIADEDLVASTKQLSTLEVAMGADLAELRTLNGVVGGQGEVSQELQAIETERRANEARQREDKQLLELLHGAAADPQQLVATPGSLLRSQPGVRRLKDALVDAQVRKAALLGSRSEKHPVVVAATESEQLIQKQLHEELSVAIRGVEVDLELGDDREQSLLAKWTAARERLTRVAENRAHYANLVAAVENHTSLVESARKNLAEARALQVGAQSASVIGGIDGVEIGNRPVGPGRTTITAAGGVAGLLLGFGLVFLVATSQSTEGVVSQAGSASLLGGMESETVRNGHSAAEVFVNGHADHHANRESNGKHANGKMAAVGMFHGGTLDETN